MVTSQSKSNRYTKEQLNVALDLIEEGASFSEVERETQINKSILAREMRKRKNSKARVNIDRYLKEVEQLRLQEVKSLKDKNIKIL
jgi:hypothetical protein